MSLTDITCKATKPAQKRTKLSDGGGLQHWIMPNGMRLWRLVYRHAGRQRVLAIGSYPKVSLTEARKRRDAARVMLNEGKDPLAERDQARRTEQEKRQELDTFEVVAKEFIAKCRREGLSEITLWKKEWLLGLAMPTLGKLPVPEIRPLDVLEVLQKVEKRGRYETARRLRSTIGAVCRFAVITARAQTDPTIMLRGAITVPKVTSHAAITDPE